VHVQIDKCFGYSSGVCVRAQIDKCFGFDTAVECVCVCR